MLTLKLCVAALDALTDKVAEYVPGVKSCLGKIANVSRGALADERIALRAKLPALEPDNEAVTSCTGLVLV